MTQFATPFSVPVYFGYPVGLAVAIPETRQQLYFERVYAGTSVIRSTPINAAGLVYLQELGPIPEGCTAIHSSITNLDRKTEADPVISVPVTTTAKKKFNTPLEQPVLFRGYPMNLGIGLSNTRQTLYFEREYLNQQKQTIGIRSEIITDRETLALFTVDKTDVLPGTRWINACITNIYRATELNTFEYTLEEHNSLEYN